MAETETRNIVITHAEDVDGIMAAALLTRLLLNVTAIHLVSHQNQDVFLAEFSHDLAGYAGANVFVLDLSLKRDYLKQVNGVSIMKLLVTYAISVTWIDHHDCDFAEEVRATGCVVELGGAHSKCATSLVFTRYFDQTDEEAKKLADIAQFNDYHDPAASQNLIQQGVEMQRLITYLNCAKKTEQLRYLIGVLAHHYKWQAEVMRMYVTYWRDYSEAILALEKSWSIIQMNGYEVLLLLASPILPQKEIMRCFRTEHGTKVNALIGIFPQPVNNVMVFAGSKDDGFPVEEFCRLRLGGSRGGDGGFSLPSNTNWTDLGLAEAGIKALYHETFFPFS